MTFRIAFVPGVSPDKWARRWNDRFADDPIELLPAADADQLAVLGDGRADMSFVRLPIDRDGLHLISLYAEIAVVVVSVEDELSLLDELTLADLADHQLVTDPQDLPGWAGVSTVERLPFPAMNPVEAIEVVASGTGVAVMPMSIARLHHRKDVVSRPLTDGPSYPVGLAWLRDNDDPRTQEFVGVVRGRTANSSRGRSRRG